MILDTAEGEAVPSLIPERGVDNWRILAQLKESNNRIADAIKEMQAISEREVLACGNVLSSIVDESRQLAEETSYAVTSSLARSEEITGRFVRGMREDIFAQETAVQNVLDLAGSIEEAIAAINDLTLSSKVLAINARIEAARLGAQGRGFTVIADSLSGLSSVIRQASDKVGLAIEAVRLGLPSVKARAVSMNERTKVFIDEVAEQVRSASLQSDGNQSGSRLAKLTELSNQALSHLQFQDPMAQKLLAIVGDLEASKERVRRQLSGEAGEEREILTPVEAAEVGKPVSGEIMLF